MDPQRSQVVLTLNAEVVGSLKEGVNFKKNPVDGKCYIIYKSGDEFKACRNQCKHQGGLFVRDVEDLAGRWGRPNRSTGLVNVCLSSSSQSLYLSFPQDSEVHQAQLEAERFYHEVRESTGQLLAGRARWVLPPASIAKYWKTVQPVCNVQRCMTTGFILGVVFKRGGPLECNTQTLPPPYLPPKNDVSCTYEKESEKIVKHFHL